MAIHLEKITPENWRIGLSISYEQQGFVASDMILLARAYAYRESRSNAFMIHHDNCAIGMVLFYDCEERKAYEFSQLFIDESISLAVMEKRRLNWY